MNDVSLREYIEAVMEETRRAVETAEEEREKAANVLRISLEQSIAAGDSSLRDHITNQIAQIKSSLVAAERAQDKFELTVREKFATVNEFRGSLDDLSKQMATRREVETAVSGLSEMVEKARQERQHQIDDLRGALLELRSRLDVGAPQIPELQRFIAASSGRQEGVKLSTGLLFGGLAALAAVISIVVVVANILAR